MLIIDMDIKIVDRGKPESSWWRKSKAEAWTHTRVEASFMDPFSEIEKALCLNGKIGKGALSIWMQSRARHVIGEWNLVRFLLAA